jgi:hypothetical protein
MTQAWSQAARRVPRPVQVWVLDALPGEVRSGDMGGADRPADLISTLQDVSGDLLFSATSWGLRTQHCPALPCLAALAVLTPVATLLCCNLRRSGCQ